MEFRKLKAKEIEARVATVTDKGVTLLLYKDARVDQRILDEAVGALNWTRSHQLIGDRLYCTVSIYDEAKGAWVAKQDVGTESNTEAEKGQASDSFKRACFNWGVGRELYTVPFLWIPADCCTITDGKNGKKVCYDRFDVASIEYDDDGSISALKITNRTRKNAVVLSYGTPAQAPAQTQEPRANEPQAPTPVPTPAQKPAPKKITKTMIATIINTAAIKNVNVPSILKHYGVKNMEELTAEQAGDVMAKLATYGDKPEAQNA